MDDCGLLNAVGVQESSGEVDDGFAAPSHHQSSAVGDGGDVFAFEIFLIGLVDEITDLRGIHADCHAFLGL